MSNTKERGRTQSPQQVALWDGARATFRGRGRGAQYVVTVQDSEGIYSGYDLVSRLAAIVERRHGADYLASALRDKVSGATLTQEHLADA